MRRICILLLLISVSIQAIQFSLSPKQCSENLNHVKLEGNTAFWKLMTRDTVAKIVYILSGNHPQNDCGNVMIHEISNNKVNIDELFLGPPSNSSLGNFGPPKNDVNSLFFVPEDGIIREIINLPGDQGDRIIFRPGSTENPKNQEKIETSTPENTELPHDKENGDEKQETTKSSTPENIEFPQDNEDRENSEKTGNSTPGKIELPKDSGVISMPGSNNQDSDNQENNIPVNTDYPESPRLINGKNSGGPFYYYPNQFNPVQYPTLLGNTENQESIAKGPSGFGVGRFPFMFRTSRNSDSKQ